MATASKNPQPEKRLTLDTRVVDKTVLDMAYERLYHAFSLLDTVAVMFSGGKDSTVCLNLSLEVARKLGKLPLRTIFFDEEAIPYQTEEYVRRMAQDPDIALEWYCLPVKHRNACSRQSPYWSPWDPACPELWVRPMPPEGITTLKGFRTDGEPEDRLTIPLSNGLFFDPAKYGRAGMIMGIRAQESITRRRAVTRREHENYLIQFTEGTSQGNIWKTYPIYDWMTPDVWTAPNKFGWDYNRAYDVMDQAGVSAYSQRCSPAYGEEPLQKLWTYQVCFPELWDKMCLRVPGANTAARYALTEIYCYQGRPEKPEGMPWPDFLLLYLAKFRPKEQHVIAARIKQLLRLHNTETNNAPLLVKVPHPETGMSWDFLLMIAMRGDLKHRKQPLGKLKEPGSPEAWQKYNEARQREGV